MFRRFFMMAMVCMLAMLPAAALAGGHVHSGEWMADADFHWMICEECDEIYDKSAHTLDEYQECTGCGAIIFIYEEGKSIYLYDENGNARIMADYDAEGNTIGEWIYEYEYEYDDNGNKIKACEFNNGVLTAEIEYITVDGFSVEKKYTDYFDDGSVFINEFDEYGNALYSVSYDAAGNIEMESFSEYTLLEDGFWIESKCITEYADGSSVVSEYGEYGDIVSFVYCNTDGIVEFDYEWEYSYDEAGNVLSEKFYDSGMLSGETFYSTAEDDGIVYTYPETVIEYYPDGQKFVTVYDEEYNIISETLYDSEGNIIE